MVPKALLTASAQGSQERPLPEKRITYLACPYTHTDHEVRAQRFQIATQAAAKLIRQGIIVYSPITMTHPIDVILSGATTTLGSDYWVAFDEAFMDACSEMVVLKVEGWKESNGIQREIEYFEKQGKPVHFLSPAELCDDHTIKGQMEL